MSLPQRRRPMHQCKSVAASEMPNDPPCIPGAATVVLFDDSRPVHIDIYLFIFIYVFIYLIYLSYVSICLSIYRSICRSIDLSICLYLYLYLYLCLCLCLWLSLSLSPSLALSLSLSLPPSFLLLLSFCHYGHKCAMTTCDLRALMPKFQSIDRSIYLPVCRNHPINLH